MDYNIIADIIIPLVAASFGGFLTLLGVLISIWNERRKNRKLNTARIKPYFSLLETSGNVNIEIFQPLLRNSKYIKTQTPIHFHKVKSFSLELSSNADCVIVCLIFGQIQKEINRFILKGSKINFKMNDLGATPTRFLIRNIYLIAKDIEGNYYKYLLPFKQERKPTGEIIYNITGISLPEKTIKKQLRFNSYYT